VKETLIELAGHRCVLLEDDDGSILHSGDDARTLIEAAMNHGAKTVVVPVSRLHETFFQLRTGLAGEILQKMVNYRLQLAIVGDISAHVAASDAFRDLIIESERGRDLIFVPDMAALERRLRRDVAAS
jgi:hypothetical protein